MSDTTSASETFPPVFATNREETNERVADAINVLLRGLREDLSSPPNLAIATAYLNVGGFNSIADELENVPRARLLLGVEPDPTTSAARATSPAISASAVTQALTDHLKWLKASRDLTGFTRAEDAAAQRFVRWLHATEDGDRKVEVRRYTQGFLHGKAFIAEHERMPAVLAGSSNFTYAGLNTNAELNLGYPNGTHTNLVQQWFDRLWSESQPFDLAHLYAARWEPHSPWLIFLRMLWERYGEQLPHDEPQKHRTVLELTGFQQEGVARMLRILEEHQGVIVADEVGLGKTFMAGEVLARATAIERQSALVVCPAALKDQMWEPFLKKYDLSRRIEVKSFETLRNEWHSDTERAREQLDQFALVVVDEAHRLRNPAAQQTEAVNSLVGGARRKKVVLLTATPVNNSLMDLHALVSLFIRNDAALVAEGIPSIRKYVEAAETMDPERLTHEHLFDLLDQVAVRRTRSFVQRHYHDESIKLEDGTEQRVEFPTPELTKLEYELDADGQCLLDKLVFALDEVDDAARYEEQRGVSGRLLLSRYRPSAYLIQPSDEFGYQARNAGLLRSALLKRFESSTVALRVTLERMMESHDAFLSALDDGLVLEGEALKAWVASDEEDVRSIFDLLDDDVGEHADADDYHQDELRQDVVNDKALLEALHDLTSPLSERVDPKVSELIERLTDIAEMASQPNRFGLSESEMRKTIVFSSFVDTTVYARDKVLEAVGAAQGSALGDYAERVAPAVFGGHHRQGGASEHERDHALKSFMPLVGRDDSGTADFDLLFTTDVLAEGVNLQRAGRIINLDLPWNPMRIVQRHGRIDRIGSRHSRVYVDCFFPAANIDDLLGLEERLTAKLRKADAAIGMGPVLPGVKPGEQRDFSDLHRLRDEDPSFLEERGGSSAQSGEEYRKRLLNAVGTDVAGSATVGPERAAMASAALLDAPVLALPYGSGSGFVRTGGVRTLGGSQSGYVFCAKVERHPDAFFRFVPVSDDWSVMTDEDGEPLVDAETLTCLMAADPGETEDDAAARWLPEHVYAKVFDAWPAARAHIHKEWMWLTDPNNLKPDVPLALRRARALVESDGDDMGDRDREFLMGALNSCPSDRVVREVRAIVNGDETVQQRLERLLEFVRQSGLEPFDAPPPRPLISPDDVHLVVWMAVQASAAAG